MSIQSGNFLKRTLSVTCMSALLSACSTAQSEKWVPLPIVTEKQLALGIHPGGEGCQMIQTIVADPVDGNFLLMGSDVGGIYRSVDSGKTWEPSVLGYYSNGSVSFAIDPNNINRAISIASNSAMHPANGIYLTTDKGITWTQVHSQEKMGFKRYHEQVAYDPTSFDEALGYSTTVYWSSNERGHRAPRNHPELKTNTNRFFKSTDGGQTWEETPDSPAKGSFIKVHPTKGYVYAGNSNGLFRSQDGGMTFDHILPDGITGLDVIASHPDHIFATDKEHVYVSEDSGVTFAKIQPAGIHLHNDFPQQSRYPTLRMIKVNPADPKNMMLELQSPTGRKSSTRDKYVSFDGGFNWQESNQHYPHTSVPFNKGKPHCFAWHPQGEAVWSIGGDFVTVSRDGGASFEWSNNGNNAIFGTNFQFNAFNPDLWAFASQDYNGAVTTNGGKSWKYLNFSKKSWGGFCYGAYAASDQVIFTGNAKSWHKDISLVITRDGGKTMDHTGIELKGFRSSYGDPTDPNVLFCFEYRSENLGQTWRKMRDCKGVLTSNPTGKRELYGVDGNKVVVSYNKGRNWKEVAKVNGKILDIAYDHSRNFLFILSKRAGKSYLTSFDVNSNTAHNITSHVTTDSFGERYMSSVAVDPTSPNIVYLACYTGFYMADNSVMRSTDYGKTWEVLTASKRFNNAEMGPGATNANWVRVHPRTREVYISSGCKGLWKLPAPTLKEETETPMDPTSTSAEPSSTLDAAAM